ncbi:MAG: hypothetical protein LBQ65_09460, partial [Tannerellaceae bacterium]|nr:hypothetical protein [Tannerellaceae bacterium]
TAKYQSVIEQKAEQSGWQACFEMLLASDICLSILNDEYRIQFLRMALEMADREKTHLVETRHIMLAIMKADNYTPFLTEAEKYYEFGDTQRSGLSEWLRGYDVCGFDVVEKYAKQFINEKTES